MLRTLSLTRALVLGVASIACSLFILQLERPHRMRLIGYACEGVAFPLTAVEEDHLPRCVWIVPFQPSKLGSPPRKGDLS